MPLPACAGEPIQPSALILDSQHSIVAMSLNSPLGAETVNGDGFGVGWHAADAPDSTDASGTRHPFVFRSIEPAWNDQTLREVSSAVRSPLFFTRVRAAAAPPIQQTDLPSVPARELAVRARRRDLGVSP